MSDSLRPRELQHSSLPCPSQSPRVGSDSCPLSWCCHLILCHPLLLPAIFRSSGSFPMSQLFISGSQSIRASASGSVLPMNIQSWFPLGLTALISLLSKGPSRIFSNTTVQKHHVSVLYRLYWVSVQFSRSVVSGTLWPHGLRHARLPCPLSPRVCSNSCPLSQWGHPTISSSVVPFSSCFSLSQHQGLFQSACHIR